MKLHPTVTEARFGDQLQCPGCRETLTLDWADGWSNSNGLNCMPLSTTHSDHITTRMAGAGETPHSGEPCTLCLIYGHEPVLSMAMSLSYLWP